MLYLRRYVEIFEMVRMLVMITDFGVFFFVIVD